MFKYIPLVSVAMATYNGDKYILEQLKSIIDQTHKPIEIIIVDDASTDRTVSLINEFREVHPIIRLISLPVNAGINKAFEMSFLNCTGEYIAISDQDDIWLPNKLETLVKAIEMEDAIYSNSLFVDSKGTSLQKDFKSLFKLQSYYSGAPFFLGNAIPGHSILLRKSFLKTLIPIPPEVMYDRWISYCAAANNGIKYVDQQLVHYRQHDNNLFGVKKNSEKIKPYQTESNFDLKLKVLKAYKKATIKSEETKQLLQQLLSLFHRQWSFARSKFFFNNVNSILVIKQKSKVHKFFFCLKMFFKPPY